MKRSIQVISKSFLPILLVFAALYAGLLSVHLSALSDAEKVTVIQVGSANTSEWKENTVDSGQELDAYREPVYLQGIELLAQEQFAEVENRVATLAAAGNTQLSQLLAARLAYAQQQYDRAKILFDELLTVSQPPMSAYFYRALTLEKLKQPQLAMADYDRVVSANANHYAARYNRADVALELGKTSQAVVDLKKAANLAGGERRARALIKLAQAYHQSKQEKLVKSTLEEAIRFAPSSVLARMELAKWYERDGQPDAALHEYDVVRSMIPRAASSYVELSKAYLLHNRVQSAEQALRSALQRHPDYAPARFGLVDLLVDQGRVQEAVEQLNALLLHDADNSRAYFQLGRISSGQKHYVEALRYYQKVLALNQNTSPETWLNMGLVYSAQKLPDQALQAYQTALKQQPQYPEAWYNIALAWEDKKQLDKAADALNQAIKLKPDYARAWFNLGVTHTDQGNDAAAIYDYQQALRYEPTYYQARLNLAVRLAQLKRLDEAIQQYQSVTQQKPRYLLAWMNMAIALSDKGDIDAALDAYNHVIELEPEHIKARERAAALLYKQKRYDEVEKLLLQVLDIDAKNIEARYDLARVYHQKNQLDDAERMINKVLALEPDMKKAQKLLTRIKTKRGKKQGNL